MAAERVILGRVRAPSGVVAIIDFGLMAEWSHDRPREDDPVAPPPYRAALAAASSGGAAFDFGPATAVAIGGIPASESFTVWGTPMAEPPFADCMRYVDLEIQPGAVVASSQTIGEVAVERARLMFADVELLGDWREGESLDGKADLCFWGRDEEQLAAAVEAPLLKDGTYGWVGIDLAEARRKEAELVARVRDNEWWVVGEVREHDHHHILLEQTKANAGGTLEIGDAVACGFLTGWGDGVFPIQAERDEAGRLVRLRIHLGTDEAVAALRHVNGMDDDDDDALADDDLDSEDDEDVDSDDENDDFEDDEEDDD